MRDGSVSAYADDAKLIQVATAPFFFIFSFFCFFSFCFFFSGSGGGEGISIKISSVIRIGEEKTCLTPPSGTTDDRVDASTGDVYVDGWVG